MANGDAAVAAGMAVVAGTADRRMGYDEINKTRDYIAQRTSTVTPITKGGTGATSAATARTALGAAATAHTHTPSNISAGTFGNGIGLVTNQPIATTVSMNAGNGIGIGGTGRGIDGAGNATLGVINANDINSSTGYNRNVSGGGVRAAYFAADGRLGTTSSSRRYKRILREIEADPLAILDLAPQLYQYNWAVDEYGDGAFIEAGLIAEDLHEAGLEWLVIYDKDNRPDGIHYERVAMAVLIATKYVWEQHKALDARVVALEENAS